MERFRIEVLPAHLFDIISPLLPFTVGQKKEDLVNIQSLVEGELMCLCARDSVSAELAGGAALRIRPSELALTDFYVLDRYRRMGAGAALMQKVEDVSVKRGIEKITTGKSLHSDNEDMMAFCLKMGFTKTPFEMYCFSKQLSDYKETMEKLLPIKSCYSRYLPEGCRVVGFSDDLFEQVHEASLKLLGESPFCSGPLIYQTLLSSSEVYSRILMNRDRVIGFAIFSDSGDSLHLHFVGIEDTFQLLGLPMILISGSILKAYRNGKKTLAYIAYRTDKLFENMLGIFKKPEFMTVRMEKTV